VSSPLTKPSSNSTGRRLDSWKEIAAFFGRDERTVRRWEKESALPVHRVPGGAKGRVFAYAGELDLWLSTPQALQGALAPQPQISPAEISEEQFAPNTSLTLARPAMWAGILVICAALATGIWLYRKNHRFAAYASTPTSSRIATGAANDLRQTARSAVDPLLGPDSVAVLPFTNVRGDASTDYLSDGITESLIGSLAHLPQLKVRSRDSVFRFKGKDIDVQTVGNNLGVSVLVSGRVMVQRDTIEISAELTKVRDNTEIWGHRYTGKRADLVSLQQQMAGDIAGNLRSTLSPADRQQVANQGTQDAAAYALYLKGRYAWNTRTLGNLQKAISYFNQAIEKDPEYALAYSGLADVYSVLPNYGGNQSEDFPKSNAAARKALELDPTLAHPHAVLGSNQMQYDWDFAGGEAEFKKSFELDPNDATAHQWYADDIGMIGSREQEALAEINLAHELDPQSLVITRVAGGIHVWARQYDEAISICKNLANQNPEFIIAHDCLAYAYWGKRMYPQVVEEWKTYGKLSEFPGDKGLGASMDEGFRTAGWNGAVAKTIELRQGERKTGYFSALIIASFYADQGDKEHAFQWLDTAYREHDWLLIGLNTFFQFDPIRSDPRFADLVRKVGLPH
jgi:TolB-like protein/Flp pilus assembly protein TadD